MSGTIWLSRSSANEAAAAMSTTQATAPPGLAKRTPIALVTMVARLPMSVRIGRPRTSTQTRNSGRINRESR